MVRRNLIEQNANNLCTRAGRKCGRFKFQIGHGQNVFHLIPLEQMYSFKKFKVDLQTPPLPQTSYMAYGKSQKLRIWILFLPWSKCIHRNLEGIIIPLKQKLNMIYRPHGHVLVPKWLFWSEMVIFITSSRGWVLKPFNFFIIFFIKCLCCSF